MRAPERVWRWILTARPEPRFSVEDAAEDTGAAPAPFRSIEPFLGGTSARAGHCVCKLAAKRSASAPTLPLPWAPAEVATLRRGPRPSGPPRSAAHPW